MFKVIVQNALTLDFLWSKVFSDEESAEKYADRFFDLENKKGGGFITATWEKI